jgi:hypothetical protein
LWEVEEQKIPLRYPIFKPVSLPDFRIGNDSCAYRSPFASEAADLIAEGKIIGWAQGRSEFGPCALGNRSILADPRRAENKDLINEMVKNREWYRPFAPKRAVNSWRRRGRFAYRLRRYHPALISLADCAKRILLRTLFDSPEQSREQIEFFYFRGLGPALYPTSDSKLGLCLCK